VHVVPVVENVGVPIATPTTTVGGGPAAFNVTVSGPICVMLNVRI
jgi:hypothetical protein